MILTLNIAAFAQPLAPELSAPADAESFYPHSTNFIWLPSENATSYQLQISVQQDFSTTFLDVSGISDTTRYVSGMDFSTTYYWRVKATNGGGSSAFSNAFSFQTWAEVSAGPDPVDLGESERFAILAHTAITNVPASAITGDIALSPTTGSFIGVTQEQITGSTFAVDASGPAGSYPAASMLTVAKGDLTTAFNDAAGRTVDPIAVSGNLGGQTLFPGLYKSVGSLEITAGDLTLDAGGNADAVWIFQIATSFNMNSGRQIFLINSANAANIYWQVGSLATFGTTSVMKGTVMAGTQITFATGATLDGRALALTADITLQQNTITIPASGAKTSLTGSEGWRVFSSAYDNVMFSSLLEPIWTQGAPGADTENGDGNVLFYNETTTDGINGYEEISDFDTMMTSGQGYAVFVYADKNGNGVDVGFPQNLRSIGSSNVSPFVYSLTNTDSGTPSDDGWNLIGNPTTEDLDWSKITKTNLNANAYVYNSSNSSWEIADGNGTGDASDTLTAYTGFFVQASAANPELSTEVVAEKTGVVVQSIPSPVFRLHATVNENASTFSTLFAADSDMEIDNRDAYALTSLAEHFVQVSSPLNGVMMARQAVPSEFESMIELPVDITSTFIGEITVSTSQENIPEDWTIKLVNNSSGAIIDLRATDSFTHTVTSPLKVSSAKKRMTNGSPIVTEAAGSGSDYTLIIERETITSIEPNIHPVAFTLEQNFPNPFNPTTMIRFDVAINSDITLQVVDMTGRVVETLVSEVKNPGSYTVSWNASGKASGMYLLRMQTNNGIFTKKMTLIK
jgi:hypothetical protein